MKTTRWARTGASLLAALWIAACGTGESKLNPSPPHSIAQLAPVQHLEGRAAAEMIDDFHLGYPATDESWAASFGEGDRIWMFAVGFPTAEEASSALARMKAAVAKGESGYPPFEDATIAQQVGYRTEDGERQLFVYSRGRWMVGIRAIVVDLEPAVASIVWAK
jgi:hypothetical protein